VLLKVRDLLAFGREDAALALLVSSPTNADDALGLIVTLAVEGEPYHRAKSRRAGKI
jgi:hypothetical protein